MKSIISTISLLAFGAFLLVSCSKEPLNQGGTAPKITYKISIVSGNNQTGPLGTTLGQPLRVFVTDEAGVKQIAATVLWSVVDGYAALSAPAVATDAEGYAEITVTPNNIAGVISIRAKVSGSTAEVVFSAIST